MIIYTLEEFAEVLRKSIESGRFRGDDKLMIEYWSYEDVVDYSAYDEGGELDYEQARAVFDGVVSRLRRYDNVDNDVVRDMIAVEIERSI